MLDYHKCNTGRIQRLEAEDRCEKLGIAGGIPWCCVCRYELIVLYADDGEDTAALSVIQRHAEESVVRKRCSRKIPPAPWHRATLSYSQASDNVVLKSYLIATFLILTNGDVERVAY